MVKAYPTKDHTGQAYNVHLPTDHLANFRSYIRTGQRPELDSNGAQYIDTLDFWKDSYHRLQNQVSEQKARVYALERELDIFKNAKPQIQSEQSKKKPPPVTARGKKRKRATVNVNHPEIEEQDVIAGPANTVTDPQNTPGFDLRDPQLPDAFYALQKSLSVPSTEPHVTASIIIFITSTIRSWACKTNHTPSPDHDEAAASMQPNSTTPQADTTTTDPSKNGEDGFTPATVRIIFPVILVAIDKLSSNPAAHQYQQQCIYAIIKLLKDMLDQMCNLASSTSDPDPQTTKPTTKKPRRSARVSGRNPPAPAAIKHEQQTPAILIPSNDPPDEHQHLTNLSGFLTAAIQAVHSDSSSGPPSNQTIQEGWMFFLLQRISEVLKTFVFGEDDEAWLRNSGDDDPIMHSGALQNDNSQKWKREEERRARKRKEKERQAPYLILLLEKSTACFQSAGINMDDSQTTTISAPPETTTPLPPPLPHPHSPLLRSQPLQSTILTLIFGPSSTTLFKSALPGPHVPNRFGIEDWAGISREDIVDKFKAEVWRLVGWESLAGYLA
ncbi:MAG: hypothetical protein L6R42_006871 [Xanthoria sp. 1 TBL-2021]|nr:MAG: hypothetical protein L6R42_006871 [Xanthoria sp. 1 TBL-2021]